MLLIRENPPLLPLAHRIPHGQGVGHGGPPGLVVPDNPPQKAEVAGGNPVVIVQIQGQEGADIHAENQVLLHILWKQNRVQAVESFHNNNGVPVQLQGLACVCSPPG